MLFVCIYRTISYLKQHPTAYQFFNCITLFRTVHVYDYSMTFPILFVLNSGSSRYIFLLNICSYQYLVWAKIQTYYLTNHEMLRYSLPSLILILAKKLIFSHENFKIGIFIWSLYYLCSHYIFFQLSVFSISHAIMNIIILVSNLIQKIRPQYLQIQQSHLQIPSNIDYIRYYIFTRLCNPLRKQLIVPNKNGVIQYK